MFKIFKFGGLYVLITTLIFSSDDGYFETLAKQPNSTIQQAQFSLPAITPVSSATNSPVSPYVLGGGDQIEITVIDYKEFNGIKVILPDGTISLPVIGSVMAANRSPNILAQDLAKQLRPFLKNPVVTVAVISTRPLRINVAGEVQRPGAYQLSNFNPSSSNTNDSLKQIPTVNLALIAAGGVTQNAEIRQVLLRRISPKGEPITIVINLWDAIWSGRNTSSNIVIQDGDSLFIPKLALGDTLDRRLIARSNLAPKTVRVRVVGEVKKPGEVEVSPNSSISSAIAIAGGPTDKAQMSNVTFVRLQEDGKIERQTLNLSELTDTYQVQDGDVVIVPKSDVSATLDFSSQLLFPLNVLFNLFR